MVGMKAMNAKVRVAIDAILFARVRSWKKMKRLMTPKIQRGTKIEMRLTPGYLYMTIRKWTYWKFFTFGSKSSPLIFLTPFGGEDSNSNSYRVFSLFSLFMGIICRVFSKSYTFFFAFFLLRGSTSPSLNLNIDIGSNGFF